MPLLTATYGLTLSNPIRIQIDDSVDLTFEVHLNAFRVSLAIIRCNGPTTMIHEQLKIWETDQIIIAVRRDEPDDPPDIKFIDGGGRDFTDRFTWFMPKLQEYQEIAVTVIKRLLEYFKYTMKSPCGIFDSALSRQFANAEWKDCRGNVVDCGITNDTFDFRSSPGPESFGEKAFAASDIADLNAAIETAATPPSSAQEFLSDSQSSAIERNYRRSVLELAIACEVAIKQAFFVTATAAGAAFEFMEDKSKVSLRAIELLDGPAFEAFGESFKVQFEEDFRRLNYLFRCRNKIAHRALAEFRDDGGIRIAVDRATLRDWRVAAEHLFDWLEKHTGRKP